MTPELLSQAMPLAAARIAAFAAPLINTMDEFDIRTPKRQAAFLAQVAHESGSLRYVREIADGSAYDTGELAKRLGNTPEKDGDGQRYKGRGLIQITGRDNYYRCGVALDVDLIARPERLEETVLACRSSGWFWQSRMLNRFADKDEFGAMTKAINGGYNGLDDRIAHWLRARRVLGVS